MYEEYYYQTPYKKAAKTPIAATTPPALSEEAAPVKIGGEVGLVPVPPFPPDPEPPDPEPPPVPVGCGTPVGEPPPMILND